MDSHDIPSTHEQAERNETSHSQRRHKSSNTNWYSFDSMFSYLMGGAIGGMILGAIGISYYWKNTPEQRLARELHQETSRQERRQRVQDTNLREDQICVVCKTNAREIILLPCGHVCICGDCSVQINNKCPICRKSISAKAPAHIA